MNRGSAGPYALASYLNQSDAVSLDSSPVRVQAMERGRLQGRIRPLPGDDRRSVGCELMTLSQGSELPTLSQGSEWPTLSQRADHPDETYEFDANPHFFKLGAKDEQSLFADFYAPPVELYATSMSAVAPHIHNAVEAEVDAEVILSAAPEIWQFNSHESVPVDTSMHEAFAATWDANACCVHEPLEYTPVGQPYIAAPSNNASSGPPPGGEETIDLLYLDRDVKITQPEVVFVTDPVSGEVVPMATALMLVSSIQGKATARVLRVLFDSGGTGSMAHRRVCPPGTEVTPTPTRQVNTLAGHLSSSGKIEIQGMRLPEFDRNRVIDSHEFGTFDTPCQYDLILGTEFLAKMGIKLDYEKLQVEWLGIVRPMNTNKFTAERRRSLVDAYLLQMEDDDELDDLACYATAVMDAKYEAIEADDIIQQQCSHLTAEQQNDLRILFAERKKLFDGTLGKFEGAPMHIELEDNARPVYRRPYPVPHSLRETFRKELNHLVELGVLSPCGESQWALPTFIVPKKPLPGETEGRVRWVSDFRELNKVIIKPVNYTLPIITDILRKHHGYQYFSKLDISMQYYTFELTEEAKNLCVISTPFGNYKYNRAPMGLRNSPAFAQARMEEILRDIDETDVYIDDVGVFTTSWERHVQVLKVVLERDSKLRGSLSTLSSANGPSRKLIGSDTGSRLMD